MTRKLPEDSIYKSMVVNVGGHTIKEIYKHLGKEGFWLPGLPGEIFSGNDKPVKIENHTLKVVFISAKNLTGNKECATIESIHSCAQGYGLEIGPEALAPYLRLEYTNQPEKEQICVPVEKSKKNKTVGSIFIVGTHCQESTIRFVADITSWSREFTPEAMFAFVDRR